MDSSTDMLPTQDSTSHELASVQQGIWLDQIAHPDLPYYNIGMSLEIRGEVNIELFEQAIEQVANHHDALRLSFSHEGGIGRQRVLPHVKVKLEVVEFSEADDDAGLAMDYLREAFRQPFESLTGQLWEAQLVRCGPDRHYWLNRYHHLVTDGIGVALIGHAVGAVYNALLAGNNEVAPGQSYLAFLDDDRTYLQSSRYERDRQFWQDTYAQLPPSLLQRRADFKTGQANELAPSAQVQAMLPRALYNALTQFASERSLSVAHVLISVVGTYFCRTVGVDEIVIGMPVHNRTTARAKTTVGMFSSVSPIRLPVDPQASLLELMHTAGGQLRRCYRHQRFPIAELNRTLRLAQTGRRQLFDVSLSFESLDGDVQFGGASSRAITMDNGYEQTPMAIFVRDYHPFEDVHLDFNFNTAYFSLEEARHLQQCIVSMLEAVLEGYDTSVADFPLMSPAELQRVQVEFNASAREYPREVLIHSLFEQQAELHPHACAVRGDAGPLLSYGQLNRQANQLAHRLIELGVEPDARVAVCLKRGPEMVVALLGILKAGGAYVPIDPDLPSARQAFMLSDSVPRAVLSCSELLDHLPALNVPLLAIDLDAEGYAQLAAQPEHNPEPLSLGLTPKHLAYVLYTSGSTGTPKGVMNEHLGVVNRLLWARDEYCVDANDRILQKTPFGFDVSVWEFFLPLLAGAELVMARPGGHQEPDYLASLMRQAGVTMLHFVPSMLDLFLEHRDSEGFPDLRRVLCSGEALPRSLQRRFEQQMSGIELHNLYGPTEAAIDVTAWLCLPSDFGESVPIGRPIANIQMHVLDSRGQPQPLGVAGELHIGGIGVARGYLNQPQLTAERFVVDGFSSDPEARLYKTGDLGRWLDNGALEYLGRNDFQVKIRGLRIEIGEVEAALALCPGVREVVVIAREDNPEQSDSKRLVAYLCGEPASAEQLRSELLKYLPEYMVPSAFVHLDALPLTANGKLDRRALPAPGLESLASKTYEAPQGATEIAIAEIWKGLLQLDQVGRHDGFLELGGHSLLTVQLQARLHQDLEVEIDLRTLFAQTSLSELAQSVEQASQSTVEAISVVSRDQALPLSLAQQRLWFLDQLDHAASVAYHMPAALHLRGELDRSALQRALDRIVARHESLRTTFERHNGEVRQQFAAADIGFALSEHDLQSLTADARQTAVEQLTEAEAREAFDLSQGPLIRGRLLRLAEDEHILLVTQHHIVSDGWSVAVLIGEFNALYAAFSQGLDDPLPALALQYADYAAWQQQHLQGERLQAQTGFWKQHLGGAPALLELPTDHTRPQVQTYRGATLLLTLPASLSARLRRFSQQQELTPFMTLLGAWSILLSRLSNQPEVVIGTPVANRPRRETEALIGFFVNTLALRVNVQAHSRVDQLLAAIKATALDAYSHQDLPFEQVVEVLQPERSLGHSPLFQAMLVLGNTPQDQALALPGLNLTPLPQATGTTQFDVSLSLNDDGHTISGQFEYATDLFDESTVVRWSRHLLHLLDAMLDDAAQPLATLPLLDDPQRQQLLTTFNPASTALDETPNRLPHAVFEAQAARTPDAVALVCAGQTLSYAELNTQANRIAHQLIALGVQPDDTVGLCARRSPEMVIGLLGIMKAGAAYVPLDPQYPAERLAHMLADSAPRALVRQQGLELSVPEGLPTLELGSTALLQSPTHNPVTALNFDHLAYVIYTSGSTGLPKGVMVEHRGLRNLLDWYLEDLAFHAGDAVLLASSYNFDLTQKSILAPLMVGAALHLAEEPFNPAAIVAQIAEAGISHINMSPSAFHALVDADRDQALACLKRVVLGGEPIQIAMLEKLAQPRPTIINSYGPTECSDVVGWHTVDTDLATYRDQPIPIGKPIRNMQLHVLDSHGQLLPIGVRGEIHIGGVGVARGYLNLPQLSAERFIADPFSSATNARLYKTGDIGRWLPNGTLEYLGRNDDQVKIRGLRIELGEIEAALAALAGVREAVVIARDHQTGQSDSKRLIAYLCGEPAGAEQLRAELLTRLPGYMVPSAFVVLDALPLTPNGKLDRRALPDPGQDAFASQAYEAPQGPVELAIAGVWQQLLGLERVGRHDGFFELGGHSLMAVSLIERLREQGLNADVRSVFSAPSLRELALALADAKDQVFQAPVNRIPAACTNLTPDMLPLVELTPTHLERIVAAVPGGAANIQDIYPLAPLQQGILFHHLLGHEGDAYLVRSMLEFDNRQRLDAFIAALQQVIDRHDILRTAVHWDGLPQAVQVVQSQARLPVHSVSLDQHNDPLSQLKALSDPRHLRLDLRQAPLMRACIARDPKSERWMLALLNHHMASDHVTLEIVLEEIHAILHGQGESLATPQPYRDFIALTQATPAQVHEAYFRRRLADVDAPTAPFELLEVQGDGNHINEAHLQLSDELNLRIRAQARERGTTPAALFHVAWAQVLARCTGRDDVVFGTVVAGRLQGSAGAERALGVFINTLPVRVQLAGCGANELLLATHRDLSELLAHEQASLALAQRCSGVASALPLFTTLLNYRHQRDDSQLQWPGMRILNSAERTNYPLTLSVNDYGDALGLAVQSVQAVDPQRICALMQRALEQLTQALMYTPKIQLTQLDVLPPQERTLLLDTFNQTQADYPAHLCIQQLFEEQVRRTPDACALLDGRDQLSYAELNARANRLAHHLIAAGTQPGDLIAICVERGTPMISGLLGILKAGAAYVPLDPTYPAERLASIVEDALPRWVLADAVGRAAVGTLPGNTAYQAIESALPVELSANDPIFESANLTSAHLAYVIYTSGSTGKPKGVMIEHRNLVASTLARCTVYAPTADKRFLLLSSIAFDSSVAGIFGTLISGGTLCIPDAETARDPEAIARFITGQAITSLLCVPSLGRLVLASLVAKGGRTGLREMIVAGETCPTLLVQECAGFKPAIALYNEYGPTEATVWATVHRCTTDEQGSVPIGRPIPNTRLYLLDSQGLPVPLGVPGELYVGGAGVARGYLNRDQLNAEHFLGDPFGLSAEARMYRTGDLVRMRDDGVIEFLGRNDQQVKIRGFRVEPGEIEALMLTLPGVREAAVIAREDTPGATRLVAYLSVEPHLAGRNASSSLRPYLTSQLPDYMVPTAFVVVEQLPLTPNGKLDRRALPVPSNEDIAFRQYEAPNGETEALLAAIWTDLLGLERIGRHDNFFELGGHSLLAVQVTLRARDTFGVEVPLRGLFEHPSLLALADLITTLQLAQYESDELLDLQHEMASLSESELLAIVSKDA